MPDPPAAITRTVRASLWAWRLSVVAGVVAAGSVILALLDRILGSAQLLAPLPALAIPVVVLVGLAGLVIGTVALRWASTGLDDGGHPTDDSHPTGALWRAWRRSVWAVMLSGGLVLAAPVLLLLAYSAL